MERRIVRNVVEDAAEDVEVGELEDGRRRVDEDGAHNVRGCLFDVVGTYFAQGKADGKEDTGKWVEGSDFETAVFTALVRCERC